MTAKENHGSNEDPKRQQAQESKAYQYYCRLKGEETIVEDNEKTEDQKKQIENLPTKLKNWLNTLIQSEHLSILIGSGLQTGLANTLSISKDLTGMEELKLYDIELGNRINGYSEESSKSLGRGSCNFEDQLRSINKLIEGLKVITSGKTTENDESKDIIDFIAKAQTYLEELEARKKKIIESHIAGVVSDEATFKTKFDENKGIDLLIEFLVGFSNRNASRERANFFTTNYDRLLEYSCDMTGLRTIDRFSGSLRQTFNSSRMRLDYHYNPPGIRGEPKYLDGVIHLTKLHGSVDWFWEKDSDDYKNDIVRRNFGFGESEVFKHYYKGKSSRCLIYPNPGKDFETSYYPYADLFRDFAAAIARPNSVLITFGYGFGDNHINRIIRDMLRIRSTHLVIISFGIDRILEFFNRKTFDDNQITLMLGSEVGDFKKFVNNIIPTPELLKLRKREEKIKIEICEKDDGKPGSDERNGDESAEKLH